MRREKNVILHNLEKNKELLNTMIFDGPVNKAKIHVLQDIYAIQLTDTLFLFQNHKLKNHIDLNIEFGTLKEHNYFCNSYFFHQKKPY